eukprot:538839_1
MCTTLKLIILLLIKAISNTNLRIIRQNKTKTLPIIAPSYRQPQGNINQKNSQLQFPCPYVHDCVSKKEAEPVRARISHHRKRNPLTLSLPQLYMKTDQQVVRSLTPDEKLLSSVHAINRKYKTAFAQQQNILFLDNTQRQWASGQDRRVAFPIDCSGAKRLNYRFTPPTHEF